MSERQRQQKCVLPLKKYGTYRNKEDNNHGSSPQRSKRGWDSFQGNFDKRNPRYECGGYEPQPYHLQEDDGNEGLRAVQEEPQVRHTPYTVRCSKRRVEWNNEGRIQITVWRDTKPLEGAVGEDTQNETLGNWFKITVPDGIKYDKTWLINSIQSLCSVPFTPVDFHYVKKRALFFVQDISTASALMDVSYKICDRENRKIPIFVNTSAVPYSVRDKLEPEEMEQLKLTISKRYNISQKALDLQMLRFDPDLVGLNIDIILNRRNCMTATLQIIEKNFPELLSLNLCNNKLYQLDGLSDLIQMAPTVKNLNLSRNELNSTWELSKMKGLKLEELWLDGNPLCGTFPDQSTYIWIWDLFKRNQGSLSQEARIIDILTKWKQTINHSFLFLDLDSAIRNLFPKLLCLDGQALPPPIIIDIDKPYLINPCKESHKTSEMLKSLVMRFLQQYYLIYDSGDRQGLLGAYHDKACFSLTIPFNPEDPSPSSLCEYFKDNRNMKNLKDPYLRVQLLKHTKHDIVCSLCVLPKTQHDLNSFVVDMWFQTERLLFFFVNGVFKEVEGKSQGSVRAFSRTFIATPASSSNLCVVNDELFMRDATLKETQSSFSVHAPTTTSIFGPTLSQEQRKMVQAFSIQSGMNLQWSQN